MAGKGPSNSCCVAPAEPEAVTEAIMPAEQPAAIEPFSFSASANEFTSAGTATAQWLGNADALKGMLANDLKVEGGDKAVVLTGAVDTDAIKQQKGADVQAFFGADVTVDNLLVVNNASAAVMPPPAAKLYFESGSTNLPNDTDTSLAPIVTWLNGNAAAKAIVSGYHDATGNQAVNENLAKNRGKSVVASLKAAGIDEARIEMRKPESLDGGGDLAEARRVEVSVE